MTFTPDHRAARVAPSPNHDARTTPIDILLLHYTGMKSAEAAFERLTDPAAKVSSHYLVYEDGRVDQLVAEARRAWHAGVSSWKGATDINSRSIGIEIVNPGHDFGYRDFPEAQIDAVIALGRDIVARHGIATERVLGAFRRGTRAQAGSGREISVGTPCCRRRWIVGGAGADCAGQAARPRRSRRAASPSCRRMLVRLGYAADITHRYDNATSEVIAAFQRHFRPARVDGIADTSTIETLRLNGCLPSLDPIAESA